MTRADQIKAAYNMGGMDFSDCLNEAVQVGKVYDNHFVQYNRTFKAKICPVFKP